MENNVIKQTKSLSTNFEIYIIIEKLSCTKVSLCLKQLFPSSNFTISKCILVSVCVYIQRDVVIK